MNDADYQRLSATLTRFQPLHSMNLEQLDGFFAALLCGPEPIKPSECLPMILGDAFDDETAFTSPKALEQFVRLLMGHWLDIAHTLQDGEPFHPWLEEDEHGEVRGNDWAQGFSEGMQLLRDAAEVVAFRARQDEPVFVSQYVDYRSPDGFFRKYRVIYIDRQPFPYHLAISPHWMVHYFSADMAAHAWKLEEERAFLSAPESVLGRAGMAAIAAIGHRLDLDYAGIDFSLLPDGRLLVFEANATMLVHPEDPAGPLGHKNAFVQPILDAFENLLQQKAGG